MDRNMHEEIIESIKGNDVAIGKHIGASEPLDLKTWGTSTSDALIVLNSHFQIYGCNEAACELLGKAPEDIVGQMCPEVLRCRTPNGTVLCGTASCPLAHVLGTKESLPNEELLVGSSSTPVSEVSTSVTRITNNGNEPSVIFSMREMPALKETERISPHFVSMMSHELRAPLSSVSGFIDLLLQGHVGELTKKQRTFLVYAQESVQQLSTLVEDILFIARSDAGQFEIKQERVRFHTLVRQVSTSFQPQALKAEITLSSEISPSLPSLFVDPQRLRQALNNLVANAIKFTPPGGTVRMSAHQHDQNFVMISVTDTGCGISPEDRQHIFERFYQSNRQQQSKIGGYGLGLPITKVIIEQHGGSIAFESVVNGGTTFCFTVPIYADRRRTGKQTSADL